MNEYERQSIIATLITQGIVSFLIGAVGLFVIFQWALPIANAADGLIGLMVKILAAILALFFFVFLFVLPWVIIRVLVLLGRT
ncbi:MAG TPA: hypothetical protein VGQ00_04570 [Candidatus Norongarragalinales archaeon]|jgi:hypothetical protein|nr:hypothetical protein [Candidatus Norongarragalinales archaeon]